MKKRNREVLLWLTDDELTKLKADAEKCGLSVQSYLRLLLLKIQPKERPPRDFLKVLKALQQIGNNLNAIAAKANTIGFVDSDAYWENVRELQRVVGALMEKEYSW